MPLPCDKNFDSTISLIRHPYEFICKKSRQLNSDVFQTRIFLQPTICMTGAQAAKIFYDEKRFIRKNAMPMPIQKTLLGVGGIQGTDDIEHKHRKLMFMALLNDDKIEQLAELVEKWLMIYAQNWQKKNCIIFYDEICEILTRAVCSWAGIDLREAEIKTKSKRLTALFDKAGSITPMHFYSRVSRLLLENWLSGLIKKVRCGELHIYEKSALYVIANFYDLKGQLIEPRIAAVELLNVLRPVVAVSVYIVFMIHALQKNPGWVDRIAHGNEKCLDAFMQEIRRFYPFFPSVAARVRNDFKWRDFDFKKNTRVILDLYGTNHDHNFWHFAEKFYPERFLSWAPDEYNFIPQGGGNPFHHHRCPGERITLRLMKVAAYFLTKKIRYELPKQNLDINMSRLPALPKSKIVMKNIQIT